MKTDQAISRVRDVLRRQHKALTAEEMSDYTWLRPEIEAEIKFAEWTAGGVLRHAEFVSLRQDA